MNPVSDPGHRGSPAPPVPDFPASSSAEGPERDVLYEGDEALLPHVVAWNLTRRCNLACSHCYISAGSWHGSENELPTAECLRILDEVLAVNPAPLLILSGGEPLVRDDLEEIAAHASSGGATVVVGTNGVGLTDERIQSLKAAGVRGIAVSVDSLSSSYHDRFRHRVGALADTLEAVERLPRHALDFIVQTSLTKGNRAELRSLVKWSAERGAVSFNLYFLVPTGRGGRMSGLTPEQNEEVLAELVELEREFRGRMLVRSKCQPQIMRHVIAAGEESPLLNYSTRCPCGVHYCRITPEGKVTPCPYMPVVVGDLTRERFADVWESSPLLRALRDGSLGGRCGRCEYRKVCGGCRARAYAQTGDPLGPDDSCAYDPAGERPVVELRRPMTYGRPSEPRMPWTHAARARLERVPSFVRGVVARRVEDFAQRRGHRTVDVAVMDEVRRSMPVDFSKRLPFFMRESGSEPQSGDTRDA